MIFSNYGTYLIFSPHADDEVVGCGGTIRRIKDDNPSAHITVIVMAIGDMLVNSQLKSSSKLRTKELHKAQEILGYDESIVFCSAEMTLDQERMIDIVSYCDQMIDMINPEVIMMPIPSHNQDHVVTFEAVMASIRPRVGPNIKMVLGYPYAYHDSGFHLTPRQQVVVDISAQQSTKIYALEQYESQLSQKPSPVNVADQTAYDKAQAIGTTYEYAERFELIKLNI